MADLFGGLITIPEPAVSGVFPLMPDFDISRRLEAQYTIHKISDKKEQRILRRQPGNIWTITHKSITQAKLATLVDFYEAHRSPLQLFYFYDPFESGGIIDLTGVSTTGRYIVHFGGSDLTAESILDLVSNAGIELAEVNNSTLCPNSDTQFNWGFNYRRPETAIVRDYLAKEHLTGEQDLNHLVVIKPAMVAETLKLADRRIQISNANAAESGLFLPRLIGWDIQQDRNSSDEARFVFDDADGVWVQYIRQVNLDRADLQFFVAPYPYWGVIRLWRGFVTDWEWDEVAGTFTVSCTGGISALEQQFPTRQASTVCPLEFNAELGCPYSSHGSGGDPASCDRSLDGSNGCIAHGMHNYFQGMVIKPQPAHGKLSGWITRRSYTSLSSPLESVYGQVIPIVYGNGRQIVEGLIFELRDENEFFSASAIVSEGPIGEIGQVLLDGMTQHYGYQPVRALGDLGQNIGTQIDPDFRTSRLAFVCVRRTDEAGVQETKNTNHDMKVEVLKGVAATVAWPWPNPTGPWVASGLYFTSNPVYIAFDIALRALGISSDLDPQFGGDYLSKLLVWESHYDAANWCNVQVPKLVGSGNEPRFEFKGAIREQKPAIDHVREVLANTPIDLVYSYGKLNFKVRRNDIANPPAYQMIFAQNQNIIDGSFKTGHIKPSFNELSILFSDPDYDFAQNEVCVYDQAAQKRIGYYTDAYRRPLKVKKQITLNAVVTRSQAERLALQLLREELGGATEAEQLEARTISMSVPLVGLAAEIVDVSKVIHQDLPNGEAFVRWDSWRYSSDSLAIDLVGKTITESMFGAELLQLPSNSTGDPVEGIPGGSQGSDGSENDLSALTAPTLTQISINYSTASIGVSAPPAYANYLITEESLDVGFSSPTSLTIGPVRQYEVGGSAGLAKWVRAKWRRSTSPLEESAWSNVLALVFPKITANEIESVPTRRGTILLGKAGSITADTNAGYTVVVPYDCTLEYWALHVRTPATGGNTLFDVMRNGVSLWAVHSGWKPALASGVSSASGSNFDTINLIEGDVLTLDILSNPIESADRVSLQLMVLTSE